MRTLVVIFEAENMWKTRSNVVFRLKPGQDAETLVKAIKSVTKGKIVEWYLK